MAALGQDLENNLIKSVVRGLLPDVCEEHLYDHSIAVDYDIATDTHVIYAKWTFTNDRSVRLKAQIPKTRADIDPLDAMTIEGDLEEWKAHAIMICDAGEPVWPKIYPKWQMHP